MRMAEKDSIGHGDVISPEVARNELERLAAEQGLQPIMDMDSLRADFWPEDESVDDFVRTVRERRRSSKIGRYELKSF